MHDGISMNNSMTESKSTIDEKEESIEYFSKFRKGSQAKIEVFLTK